MNLSFFPSVFLVPARQASELFIWRVVVKELVLFLGETRKWDVLQCSDETILTSTNAGCDIISALKHSIQDMRRFVANIHDHKSRL